MTSAALKIVKAQGIQEEGAAVETEKKGVKEIKSLLRLDDLLGGCGRQMVRFPAQVTVVLEFGCGSEAAAQGVGRRPAHTGTCLLGACKSQSDP